MPPEAWGASAWRLLHTVASCVRTKFDLEQAATLFDALQDVLPCARCRAAYAQHLARMPLPARASHVAHWAYKMHDQVNERLEKADRPSWRAVRDTYKCRASFRGALPQAFVEALAASHPGRTATPALVAASMQMWRALRHFFPDAPIVSAADLRSRAAYRRAVGAETVSNRQCTSACEL